MKSVNESPSGGGPGERRAQMRLDMMRSVITEPLLSRVEAAVAGGAGGAKFEVIIALNETYQEGVPAALAWVSARMSEWDVKFAVSFNYVFACLTADQCVTLAQDTHTQAGGGPRRAAIYRIWDDADISVSLTRSVATVKADAAQRSFQACGEGIVWAVLDSGVDGGHDHFRPKLTPFGRIAPLELDTPLAHKNFTPAGDDRDALVDAFGHGSHVAGIIAGYWHSEKPEGEVVVGTERRDNTGGVTTQRETLVSISGVAPACRLVSLKVVADRTVAGDVSQTAGHGKVSWVLRAIDQIQQWNQFGRRLLVHGVNMSLGYDFDPRWFACGQSPICVEVNRLVKSGVCVVVSAGNAGYSAFITAEQTEAAVYSDISISDPGNADLAITVGSTHREMPHTYGVSYFSSRGPTGDGRMKPDLVAPGERIISCASGEEARKYDAGDGSAPALYCEQSGTSMAAPHVSGAAAAFLSVRREFIGEPERVKQILMDSAVDLRRERMFQGAGLLDLMKALQAV